MSLDYNSQNIPLAKALRKTATPQENKLWYKFLSKHPIRFQRQKAIDNFIVDFYSYKAKLVIELDGSQHYTPDGKANDNERTKILEDMGLTVIRFSNIMVDTHFQYVCNEIDRTLNKLLSKS